MVTETTALGAALLAGVGAGVFPDLAAAASHWRLDRAFSTALGAGRRQALLEGYKHALNQALTGS